jgi:uncharacterized membrane protein
VRHFIYPFIFAQLAFFFRPKQHAAPIIMMSQNRQNEEIERKRKLIIKPISTQS